MNMTAREQIDALVKLAEKASEGPWIPDPRDGTKDVVCKDNPPDYDWVQIGPDNTAFICAARNAILALTTLLSELDAVMAREDKILAGLDRTIQQLAELANPLSPALNGSYAKGEQVGYENAVRIVSALRREVNK